MPKGIFEGLSDSAIRGIAQAIRDSIPEDDLEQMRKAVADHEAKQQTEPTNTDEQAV